MRKSKIIIKLATMAYAKEFYGDQYTKSFKGGIALLKGKVIGVAGLSFEKDSMMLFSDMKDEMRPYKRDIVKAIRILGKMIKNVRYPIFAVANNKESLSEKILNKLGFTFSGHMNPEGSKIFRRSP